MLSQMAAELVRFTARLEDLIVVGPAAPSDPEVAE